jgi:hypothetical protein
VEAAKRRFYAVLHVRGIRSPLDAGADGIVAERSMPKQANVETQHENLAAIDRPILSKS